MDKLRPSDFGTYWYGISQELSKVDISSKLELIPMRSDKHATLYSVAINSLDEYSLYGYLSIPKGDPPFPTIYFVPRNASVLEIIPQGTSNLIRDKFVVFSLACRGMRNSDNPHISMYPGQLTENIETLDKYIYRGIVADTLRGLDFLITRPEVNKNALLVSGNDNALFASALHGSVTHVVSTPAYFFDTIDLAGLTASYPLEEINDYLRLHPNSKNKIRNVLSYFNLRWHAPAVTATVLLMAGDENDVYSKSKLDPLIQNITGEVTLKESDNSAYKDGLFIQQWIADEIGDGVPILPDHWK